LRGYYYRLRNRLRVILQRKLANDNQKGYWHWINKTDLYKPQNLLYESKKQVKIWKQLVKHVGNLYGKKVLDYGCSNGVWSKKYLEMGADVTGIDFINPPLYQGKKFILADIAEYRTDLKVDIIHTTAVLMHLEPKKQDKALQLIFENIKKGGHIILIENLKDTSIQIWGRDWSRALDFYGFKVLNVYGDGITQGVVARKGV
jgi:2-polyprenyl-3-methyl-5-hydroxy-6-metoxy-1,4-benzoquinol methylase